MRSPSKPILLRFLVRPFDVRSLALQNALIRIVSMPPLRAPRIRLRDVIRETT